MNNENLIDMITTAADKKPVEFADAFKTAFAEKILGRLESMKTGIAQNFFNKAE